ncbi:MAG TPA: ATP-binding protein [Thermoanaerobaculia bacterium]|nr:ATP-binding protein [Thermoanaerobaculia bacterium]
MEGSAWISTDRRFRPLPVGGDYLRRYGVAVATVAAALLARLLLTPYLLEAAPLLLFVPAILWASWYGGSGPGLLATGLSVLGGAYFFLPPFMGFSLQSTSDLLHIGIFCAVGVAVSSLNGRLRSAYERERAGRTALVLSEDRYRRLSETLEERVVQRTSELEEANAALQAFGYTVSHDLRAPLRAIQGFSEALDEDYGTDLDATGRDYTRRIVAAAGRMDLLIGDLLAYSRMDKEEVILRPVDLEGVVDEAASALADDLRARRGQISIERPLPPVLAHRPLLLQIVANLLGNAIRFVAPGVPPQVRVSAELPTPEGTIVRVWVEDNGIGIAPEHHRRIFEVFERLHGTEEYPGTGIGLAIVRKGVERMEGSVGVESSVAAGSRFWIELRRPEGGR